MVSQALNQNPVRAGDDISLDQIKKVMEILRHATNASLPRPQSELEGRWLRLEAFTQKHKRKPIWLGLAFILIVLAFYFSQPYLGHSAALIALTLASPLEFAAMFLLMCDMLLIIPTIKQFRSDPFQFVLKQIEFTARFDLKVVQELEECSVQAVQYVAKHYQYHRISLERRGATLSGSVDKIGLFPAIAALVVLWNTLSPITSAPWPLGLATIILIFHLLNLYFFGLQQRMDRIIATLESSIATRPK